jgi:hypothetical protein
MKNRWSRWIAVATVVAAAALLTLPTLAVVEKVDPIAPELRSELIHTDPPLQPTNAPGIIEDPHAEDPRPEEPGDDYNGPRLEMPERHDNFLEELRIERDGRPNDDGSPRLKDVEPGPRRR